MQGNYTTIRKQKEGYRKKVSESEKVSGESSSMGKAFRSKRHMHETGTFWG